MAMLFLDKDQALERIVALSRELTQKVPEEYRSPIRRPLLQTLAGDPIHRQLETPRERSAARAA